MWELTLREAPARLEVLGEALLLLYGSDDSGINSLLVGSLRLGEWCLLLGLAVGEKLLLSGSLALARSLGEVRVVDLLVGL